VYKTIAMNNVIKSRIAFINKLITDGKFKFIWDALIRRINSEQLAFGFKRDLSVEHPKPRVLIDISTRVFSEDDASYFIDNSFDTFIYQFQTCYCYVATTKDNIPCSRLWLIDASQNKKLKTVWGDYFPQLKEHEVLLENVFTLPSYRGMGVMSSIIDQISEKSKVQGAKYAITFGSVNNTNTARSLNYAGFQPYILRKVKWFMFNKSISYQEIPNHLMTDYNSITRRRPKHK